ncbi:hypothetical protein C5748_14890 [Phyllobacterium phragmitis]|uniref:Uncharacterized protein n=1 Tax=Phyllobacterium phragmitis TaxID=2670329 RepID=A0A2S9IQA8_9HYPH|nr:hypothetical protein [Phyllobacterium phragmitis]PRD42706.1 hypothetical protein C5748_14890 [Phyllobacterium phragmitis]
MQDPKTRNAVIAAGAILLGFGVIWLLMPRIMLALGAESPLLAGLFATLFVLAFFGVFWLRARQQKRKD